jgi:c(7)-type cytochrome triheme protein
MTKAMRFGMLVGVLVGGAAMAADLPKLPGDLTLPTASDSPGPVVFRHDSHVDTAKPTGACTACHAGTFKILGKATPAPAERITHKRMEAGQACGACHGKKAFNFDDCTNCHKM